mgnify:CR=1 FL=1
MSCDCDDCEERRERMAHDADAKTKAADETIYGYVYLRDGVKYAMTMEQLLEYMQVPLNSHLVLAILGTYSYGSREDTPTSMVYKVDKSIIRSLWGPNTASGYRTVFRVMGRRKYQRMVRTHNRNYNPHTDTYKTDDGKKEEEEENSSDDDDDAVTTALRRSEATGQADVRLQVEQKAQ